VLELLWRWNTDLSIAGGGKLLLLVMNYLPGDEILLISREFPIGRAAGRTKTTKSVI
jgi:hypothetical protein